MNSKIFTYLLLLAYIPLSAQIGTYQPLIAINQYGYLPQSKKIAVIANPQVGYNAELNYIPPTLLQLREVGSNTLLMELETESWSNGEIHPQSGDQIWWCDFSNLTLEGNYFLFDAQNNVSSAVFQIGECVYSEALEKALGAFYYQRCGTPKVAPFAHVNWADITCHVHGQQDTDCRFYNNSNDSTARDLSGGWHDAGDYNKYVNFAFEPVLDLCDAYAFYNIYNDDLGIPESGNGIPDILDEINYELQWLGKMQNSDGGILCMVGAQSYESASPPSEDLTPRVYGPATTSASYSAAALFARASMIMPTGPSAEYLQRAIDAWNWAVSQPNEVFYNSGIIVSGEQELSEYETWSRRLVAAVYLFQITGDVQYLNIIENEYQQAHLLQWSFVYPFESSLQNALLFHAQNTEPGNPVAQEISTTYTQSVSEWNNDLLPAIANATDAYRAYLSDQNYTWGSNTTKARQAHIFQNMLHYGLNNTNTAAYHQGAQGFVDYFCGVNPNQICFQTNMGNFGAEQSVKSIYHAWFHDGSAHWDEVGTSLYGPAPGFVPGGVNPSYNLDACCIGDCGSEAANAQCDALAVTPPLSQPIQKSWKDWNTSWPQNSWTVTEIGIYTQAAFIKMLAALCTAECLSALDHEETTSTQKSLVVYPNPNELSTLYLTGSVGHYRGPIYVQVMDLSGRTIISDSGRAHHQGVNHQLDISALPAGLYMVQVISGTTSQQALFIRE